MENSGAPECTHALRGKRSIKPNPQSSLFSDCGCKDETRRESGRDPVWDEDEEKKRVKRH